MYELDLSLNNLQGLICHKPNQITLMGLRDQITLLNSRWDLSKAIKKF